jgi:hypothetical protein
VSAAKHEHDAVEEDAHQLGLPARTPVLEKIERRCARAVLRRMFSASAASSSESPLASWIASIVSAAVSWNSSCASRNGGFALLSVSRTNTAALGRCLPSVQRSGEIGCTTRPQLTLPEGG